MTTASPPPRSTDASGETSCDVTNPQTPEELEQVRRSIAMLPPGAWAMRREQVLQILTSLIAKVRADRA